MHSARSFRKELLYLLSRTPPNSELTAPSSALFHPGIMHLM